MPSFPLDLTLAPIILWASFHTIRTGKLFCYLSAFALPVWWPHPLIFNMNGWFSFLQFGFKYLLLREVCQCHTTWNIFLVSPMTLNSPICGSLVAVFHISALATLHAGQNSIVLCPKTHKWARNADFCLTRRYCDCLLRSKRLLIHFWPYHPVYFLHSTNCDL